MIQAGIIKKLKTGLKPKNRMETGLLVSLAVTVLFVCFLTRGNPEAFLIDDNRTQWYPVMERAYEDLWKTGRIYCYDFYQMKGMSIAQQGYYGIMNPFMLLSFGVTKLLPGSISAITFYIGLMVVLGNLFLYLLSRRLGCGQKLAFLMTMTYSTMGCFWAFFYWYYIFNNYFLIPLLIYVFLRCREDRRSYYVFGIILAMDVWMGNVQYTCYHYILFGILCVSMVIFKRFSYLKIFLTNIMVGIGLSAPMFVLLIRASSDFQKQEFFFLYPIFYFSLMIHSVIPQGILQRIGKEFSFLDAMVMGRSDNLVLYTGMVIISLCAFFISKSSRWLRSIGKCSGISSIYEKVRASYERALKWSHEQKTMMGCAVALLFFFSLMSGGFAAHVLYVMPVIQNFRYLFKSVYAAVPLAMVLFVWSVQKSVGRTRRAVMCFIVLFVCIGVVNAYDTVRITECLFGMKIEESFVNEKERSAYMTEKACIDCKNYRVTAFFRFSGINDECFNQSNNLTKNFPTAISAFSLSGYEIATEEERLGEFDKIYSDKEFFAKYANADILKNLYLNLTTEPDKVQSQLIDNSVRYLLLDKTELKDNTMAQKREGAHLERDYREEVITSLRKLSKIRVVDVREFNEHYDLVEIDGVNSLCMDCDGNKVPLTDLNMQTVSFPAKRAGEYTLSLAYDKHLEAFLTGEDGKQHPLSIERLENDNILISTKNGCGEVILTYHDFVCTAGFVWEGIVSIAYVWLMICLYIGKNCTTIEKTTELC